MKAILITDMPKSCAECPLFFGDDECYVLKEYMPTMYEYSKDGKYQDAYLFPYKEKRLNWCPLRPMPNRNPISDEEIASEKDYEVRKFCGAFNRGWNNCLNEIGGEEEK